MGKLIDTVIGGIATAGTTPTVTTVKLPSAFFLNRLAVYQVGAADSFTVDVYTKLTAAENGTITDGNGNAAHRSNFLALPQIAGASGVALATPNPRPVLRNHDSDDAARGPRQGGTIYVVITAGSGGARAFAITLSGETED